MSVYQGMMLASIAAGSVRDEMEEEVEELAGEFNQYVFRAKSQIHGFRAAINGRKLAEDRLIAALKAENANHPLASREAVEAIAMENGVKSLTDPEIIKKTYPDGVLPEGAVIPPGLVKSVA